LIGYLNLEFFCFLYLVSWLFSDSAFGFIVCMKTINVDNSIITDAVNIKDDVYSPLVGFLGEHDLYTVLYDMRLRSGGIWSMPIVVGLDKQTALKLAGRSSVKLVDASGGEAVLEDIEVYANPKQEIARHAFGTTDIGHPGVRKVLEMGDYLLGGRVVSAVNSGYSKFTGHYSTPAETRQLFREKGWERVVAFQTRNVPHRGHEFLQRYALDNHTDGLFVQPVIGRKKPGDFRDEHIIGAYQVLFEHYYPKDKAHLGILPIDMRYAGPREAVMHALIRRNYGCTHFIVGRDHAGVGDFYHPTAAHTIFDEFQPDELGIEILKYGEVGFHPGEKEYVFVDEYEPGATIGFSGTELRNHLVKRQKPPEHILRPEVYHFLAEQEDLFVE
jgi:sulfate adenylyltransferase